MGSHVYRLVVPEVTHMRREKLSPLTSRDHMCDDLRDKYIVFFFCILLIEDAVGCISKSDRPEAVMHIGDTVATVEEIAHIAPAGE